jgi:thiamine phosphate synthase YjbQ (UPF0047 family)
MSWRLLPRLNSVGWDETSESIPIAARRLQLGTWQGLFLYELRAQGSERSVVVSVIGTTE